MLFGVLRRQSIFVIKFDFSRRRVVHTAHKLGGVWHNQTALLEYISHRLVVRHPGKHARVNQSWSTATRTTVVYTVMRVVSTARPVTYYVHNWSKVFGQSNAAQRFFYPVSHFRYGKTYLQVFVFVPLAGVQDSQI